MSIDRYSGDPKLSLSQAGAEINWISGQPVMDQGLENQALLSLFTRQGWAGNAYLAQANQVGSDFQDVCRRALTLKSVTTDIPDAALRALKSDFFPSLSVNVSNPASDRISLTISLGPGASLSMNRVGLKWIAEAGKA